ncbi:MAG: LysR family transcriptional regulator [Gammaproteobacteria bacterium]|nr:MAG: LysR family transcriptional regulator [Gammaproteobacteria bacterium]
MDSFEGIIEFVAVAECQGFTAAARQLDISASHVSRQVSRLEDRLGAALFARSTRSVNLTDAGQLYYQQCKELVTGLQQANEQVATEQVTLNGTLRISAAGAFAEQFVAPALIEFAGNHPELSIEMDFDTRMTNFIEDGIDFAIRYGQLADSGLVARKLLDRPLMAAASPEYLEQHGIPNHPDHLKHHSCLVTNNNSWQFEMDGKPYNIRISGRWRSNNAHAIAEACKQGLGIAYMPKSSFLDALEKGDVVPVLQPYWSRHASSWIVYQNRRFLPLRARLAINHLLSHFEHWRE